MEVTGVCPAGFPHSEICGSKPTCGSPQLFAAGRVLRRQMVPWHPPCALSCLISYPETILLSPASASILRSPPPPSGFRFLLPLSAFLTFDWSSRKTHFSSVCSCQGSVILFSKDLRAGPENDTASKNSLRQPVLFALSSTALSD